MSSLNHTNSLQLQSLVNQYHTGWTLPKELYTTEAANSLDAAIFQRNWFHAASVCDIPDEGDYIVVNVGRESIILVHNLDGEVRGFHNVCCHRGSQVLSNKQGSCANLVCHYHQWTYNLDGNLIYAGIMGKDFDTSKFRLKPVYVEVVFGLIFVNMTAHDESIERVKKMATPYLQNYDLSNLKVACVDEDIRAANWKLAMENNRECFHCVGNHPELVVSLLAEGFGSDSHNDEVKALLAEKSKEWDKLCIPHQDQDFPDGLWMRLARLPLTNNSASQTVDGSLACKKLIAGFEYAETSELSVWANPNSWHHLMNDHVVTFSVLPIDAGHCMVRTSWLVNKEAVEGVDYDLEHLTKVWKKTNEQDARLFESVMVGLGSSAYRVGPLAEEEQFVVSFLSWYVDQAKQVLAECSAKMDK